MVILRLGVFMFFLAAPVSAGFCSRKVLSTRYAITILRLMVKSY